MQRHDMDTARRHSASAALAKMARIIPTDDDIFDENQKIQLGCTGTGAGVGAGQQGEEDLLGNQGEKGGGRGGDGDIIPHNK